MPRDAFKWVASAQAAGLQLAAEWQGFMVRGLPGLQLRREAGDSLCCGPQASELKC